MELTINNLIKLILGIVVFIAVVAGLYLVFKNKIIGLFEGIPGAPELFLSLL